MRALGPLGPGWFIYFRSKKQHSAQNAVDGGIDYVGEKRRKESEVIAIIMAIEDQYEHH
jgi:hypothetical protein